MMSHVDNEQELLKLFASARAEAIMSAEAWSKRNAGLARVAARRSAGMAIRAVLKLEPREGYGTNFMHHLAGLADDMTMPPKARESAWRLANRPAPVDGFIASEPMPTEPADDANTIILASLECLSRSLPPEQFTRLSEVKR